MKNPKKVLKIAYLKTFNQNFFNSRYKIKKIEIYKI